MSILTAERTADDRCYRVVNIAMGANGPGDEILFWLDSPANGSASRTGLFRFAGWTFGRSERVSAVHVRIDGQAVESIPVGLHRPDVAAHFSESPRAQHSGFAGFVDFTNIGATAKVELLVQLERGAGEAKLVTEIQILAGTAAELEIDPNEVDEFNNTSQHGEAEYLLRLLQSDSPKYLVDVGAHDGYSLSNSFPFIQRGWKGLLFEPLPSVFRCLEYTHQRSPSAVCINKACAEKPGVEQFFLGADGDLGMNSTLCRDENDWFDKTRTRESIDVVVTTLTDELRQYGFPRDFSLLLVDAEGMDYEVLCGLDFAEFQPRVILTEEYPHNPEKHQRKYDLLASNGYQFRLLLGCNSLWIRADIAATLPST